MRLNQLAIPIALAVGAGSFLLAFYLLQYAYWSLAPSLLFAVLLCIGSAIATWYLLDSRSSQEVQFESYTIVAEGKVADALRKLREIQRIAGNIHDEVILDLVQQISKYVETLFERVRKVNPNTLDSSATIIIGYLKDLEPVIEQVADIEQDPSLYDEAEATLAQDRVSIEGFRDFVKKSIILVNKGKVLEADVARKMLQASKFTSL